MKKLYTTYYKQYINLIKLPTFRKKKFFLSIFRNYSAIRFLYEMLNSVVCFFSRCAKNTAHNNVYYIHRNKL